MSAKKKQPTKDKSISAHLADALNRPAILFIAMIAASALFVDYPKMRQGIEQRLAGKVEPRAFYYLLVLNEQGKNPDIAELDEYIFHFNKILEMFPDKKELNGLLGFCHYYRGDLKKAERSFYTASREYPDNFWNFYNLGVIYLQKKEPARAKEAFENALKVSADSTILLIQASSLGYQPILENIPDPKLYLTQRMQIFYDRCREILEILNADMNAKVPEQMLAVSFL